MFLYFGDEHILPRQLFERTLAKFVELFETLHHNEDRWHCGYQKFQLLEMDAVINPVLMTPDGIVRTCAPTRTPPFRRTQSLSVSGYSRAQKLYTSE